MKLPVIFGIWALLAGAPAAASAPAIPTVGCPSDGQTGPLPAPRRHAPAPHVPAAAAQRLAWYVSNNTGGVLAPRGWHCFEQYGSDGSVLLVTPQPLHGDQFSATLTGPAVQVSFSFGDTSGRFAAARIAARLFPDRRAFVQDVMAEGIEPASDFPFGPFAHDTVRRINRSTVALTTPPLLAGMGTSSRLAPSADPIHGLARMDGDNNATLLAVRLPAAQADLAHAIVSAMVAS